MHLQRVGDGAMRDIQGEVLAHLKEQNATCRQIAKAKGWKFYEVWLPILRMEKNGLIERCGVDESNYYDKYPFIWRAVEGAEIPLTTSKRLIQAIQDNPDKTAKELAEIIGERAKFVRELLKRMRDREQIYISGWAKAQRPAARYTFGKGTDALHPMQLRKTLPPISRVDVIQMHKEAGRFDWKTKMRTETGAAALDAALRAWI